MQHTFASVFSNHWNTFYRRFPV